MAAFSVKTSRVLLESAARTASQASQIFTDPAAQALRLYLNLTVVPGGGGISVVVRGYDKLSGNYVELTTGGIAVSQVGTYAYEMMFAPDPAFGNIRESVSRAVPFQWDAIVKNFDGLSYTYSLSAEVVM